MRRKVKCSDCGSIITAAQFEREGCWYCTQGMERDVEEADFREFMELSEEDRWRQMWTLTARERKNE
jgi:3'-phosphoadenosine 5'-phosphosulfate sulfotransferase (PAPS reductase)/FAD synthetase